MTDLRRRIVRDQREEARSAARGAAAHPQLREERFALVDDADGPGYNRAVRDLCRRAGFALRAGADQHGPMAWETAVRANGCVGLTTRSAAVSSARDVQLLALDTPAHLPAELLVPRHPAAPQRPRARAFAALARDAARYS